MTSYRIFVSVLAALLITGCAHQINVTPDVAKLERTSITAPRIAANVGYYIPHEASSIEITTPGGGGDNVRYFPYRDIEPGFHKMLSNVFTGVVKLTSIAGLPGVDYIIAPDIVTSSGGSGFFTWPPTNFTVDLTCNVRDAYGKLLVSPRVVGTGSADTSERLSEHGIAGKRAAEDALLKMQASLLEARIQSLTTDVGATQTQTPAAVSSTSRRLAEIKELKDKGIITQQEYEAKRKAILDAL